MDRVDEKPRVEDQNHDFEREDFQLIEAELPDSVNIAEIETELTRLLQKEMELEGEIKKLKEDLENDKNSLDLTVDDLSAIEKAFVEAEILDKKCSELLGEREEILKLGLFRGKGQKDKANKADLKITRESRNEQREQALLKSKSAGLELPEGNELEYLHNLKREVENSSENRERKELELKAKQLELREIKRQIDAIQKTVNQYRIEQPEELVLEEEMEDNRPGPEDFAVKKDLIERALSDIELVVSERELEILKMLYIEGLTTVEVAGQQKVTRGRIGQIRDRALEKINKAGLDRKYKGDFQ